MYGILQETYELTQLNDFCKSLCRLIFRLLRYFMNKFLPLTILITSCTSASAFASKEMYTEYKEFLPKDCKIAMSLYENKMNTSNVLSPSEYKSKILSNKKAKEYAIKYPTQFEKYVWDYVIHDAKRVYNLTSPMNIKEKENIFTGKKYTKVTFKTKGSMSKNAAACYRQVEFIKYRETASSLDNIVSETKEIFISKHKAAKEAARVAANKKAEAKRRAEAEAKAKANAVAAAKKAEQQRIAAERQAAIEVAQAAEKARWDALTPEEQQAELHERKRREQVDYYTRMSYVLAQFNEWHTACQHYPLDRDTRALEKRLVESGKFKRLVDETFDVIGRQAYFDILRRERNNVSGMTKYSLSPCESYLQHSIFQVQSIR